MQLGSAISPARFSSVSRSGGSRVATRWKFTAGGFGATALLVASQALAQSAGPATLAAPSITVPAGSAVAAFYDTYQAHPLWFHGGVDNAAVTQLVAILQRAPFDGFAAGSQLAADVQ